MRKVNPQKRYKVLLDGTVAEFTVVDSRQSNPACGQISSETPIAQALLSLELGSSAQVDLPNGRSVRVALIDIG
ncbi:MAG: GreA/GreB family elongation factor [Patescibacteria group bacterium]